MIQDCTSIKDALEILNANGWGIQDHRHLHADEGFSTGKKPLHHTNTSLNYNSDSKRFVMNFNQTYPCSTDHARHVAKCLIELADIVDKLNQLLDAESAK